MDKQQLCNQLSKKGYTVHWFDTVEAAVGYLQGAIVGKTVGFGDSQTLAIMALPQILAEKNTVYDPQQTTTNEAFLAMGKQALTTQVFLTSVNGVAETGELVNLDGTGNRIAGSLFGHEQVYFVVGRNKITPTLETAIHRTRNIAAPANARRLGLHTPCAKGEPRCYDCNSPDRICNGLVVHLHKMEDMAMDVVFIDQDLGI